MRLRRRLHHRESLSLLQMEKLDRWHQTLRSLRHGHQNLEAIAQQIQETGAERDDAVPTNSVDRLLSVCARASQLLAVAEGDGGDDVDGGAVQSFLDGSRPKPIEHNTTPSSPPAEHSPSEPMDRQQSETDDCAVVGWNHVLKIVLTMRMTTAMLAVNIGARTMLSRVHLHIRRKRKRKRRRLFCFPTHARPKFTNLAKRSQPRHLRRFPDRSSPKMDWLTDSPFPSSPFSSLLSIQHRLAPTPGTQGPQLQQ